MEGPWASPSLTVACSASAWNSSTASVLCRERLWVVVDLNRSYRNILNECKKLFLTATFKNNRNQWQLAQDKQLFYSQKLSTKPQTEIKITKYPQLLHIQSHFETSPHDTKSSSAESKEPAVQTKNKNSRLTLNTNKTTRRLINFNPLHNVQHLFLIRLSLAAASSVQARSRWRPTGRTASITEWSVSTVKESQPDEFSYKKLANILLTCFEVFQFSFFLTKMFCHIFRQMWQCSNESQSSQEMRRNLYPNNHWCKKHVLRFLLTFFLERF